MRFFLVFITVIEAWGPIYWRLIGSSVGFILGFAIRLFMEKVVKKKQRLLKGTHSELIMIVDYEEPQGELVEIILFGYFAFGLAKIKGRKIQEFYKRLLEYVI